MSGPILRFNTDAVVAVTGAAIPVKLDDVAQPMNTAILVRPAAPDHRHHRRRGARAYLAVRGGVQVPEYLGSKSTFTLGQFGGHGGRVLRAGDVLHLAPLSDASAGTALPEGLYPALPAVRELRVIYGPHGAPEYFTEGYIARFFATDWEVHFNSSRTGVRLIGETRVGARERRRGRPAPVEHPRQPLRHRRGGLHRRYAGDPRQTARAWAASSAR